MQQVPSIAAGAADLGAFFPEADRRNRRVAALVHLVGAPVTGMPANPARAVGVALLSPLFASRDLWVFVLGPIVGGAIAAVALRLAFGAAEKAKTNLPSAADERAR